MPSLWRNSHAVWLSFVCLLNPQLSVSVAAPSTAAAADKEAQEQRSQAVQAFFQDRLGLSPADDTGAYLSYRIPAAQSSALPEFLQELKLLGPSLESLTSILVSRALRRWVSMARV